MGTVGNIGTIGAQFTADTRDFDASVEGTGAQLGAAAQQATKAAQEIATAGAVIDRTAQVQERAAERARRAWQQELIQQDRRVQKEQEVSRAKELAALRADIEARSTDEAANAQERFNAALEAGLPRMAAASAAVRLLEGGMNNNVRAAERFLTSTLGLGPVLEMLFPVAGAIAFAGILEHLIEEVAKFVQDWDGLRKIADEALQTMGRVDENAVSQAAEHLRMARAQQVADAELRSGRSGRSAAGEEAGARFDMAVAQNNLKILDDQIAARRQRIADLEHRAAQTRVVSQFGDTGGKTPSTWSKTPSAVTAPTEDAKLAKVILDRENLDLQNALGERRNIQADIALSGTTDSLRKRQQQEDASRGDREASSRQMEQWRQQLTGMQAQHSMSLDEQASYWQKLADSVRRGSVLYTSALQEANKARAESARQYQESFISGVLDDARARDQQKTASDRINDELTATWVTAQKRDDEAAKQMRESATRAFEAALQQQKAADQLAEERVRLELGAGQISRGDAALQLQRIHEESFAQWSEAAASFSTQFPDAPVPRAADALREYGMQQQRDVSTVASTTVLGELQDTLNRFTQAATDLSAHMSELAERAIDSLNSSLSNSLMGPSRNRQEYWRNVRNSTAGAVRGVGSQALNFGFQQIEGSVLGAFGFGKSKKPDGTEASPLWVRLAGGAKGAAALLSTSGGTETSSAESTGAGNMASKVVTIGLGGLLQGAFASGGDVSTGAAALVGENGPELFLPATPGRVIPNDQITMGAGSVNHNISIDARGSQDPAATEMAVHRAMRSYMGKAGTLAVVAQKDYQRRTPSTRR